MSSRGLKVLQVTGQLLQNKVEVHMGLNEWMDIQMYFSVANHNDL